MKANIPRELEKAINEKIMLDLQIHVLNQKMKKGMKLDSLLKDRLNQLREVNSYLRKQGVKVAPPKRRDEIFIDYYFSQYINGGYKEGILSYWDIVLKQRTEKRLNAKGDQRGETEW